MSFSKHAVIHTCAIPYPQCVSEIALLCFLITPLELTCKLALSSPSYLICIMKILLLLFFCAHPSIFILSRSELRATNPRVIATLSSSKPSSRRAQTPSSSAQAKGVRGMNISIVGATSTLPVQGNWTALGGSEIELETGLRSVRGTEEDHLADDRKEMDFQSPDLENVSDDSLVGLWVSF